MYIAKKAGDNNPPCLTPAYMANGEDIIPFHRTQLMHLLNQSRSKWIEHFGNKQLTKILNKPQKFTQSNALDISNAQRVAVPPLSHICFTPACNARIA